MTGIARLAASSGSLQARLGSVVPPLMRFAFFRSYGAAAPQPALDHDYNYDYEIQGARRADFLGSAAMDDSEGAVPARGVQWVFIGNQSSKKHVYAERLSELLEVPHISVASLVRQELSPCSSLHKLIANSLNEGRLVPEDILLGLLSKRLEDGHYYMGETGFILDGIPRTQAQAVIIDQLADIDLVVNFKTIEDYLCRQSNCRMSNSEIVKKRQKNLLEDYYRKQWKLLDFQVAEVPAETWHGLLAALQLRHVDAAHSSSVPLTESSWP